MADEIVVDGEHYISSKRASESTGYTQDYIGQLARKDLVDSRRIGGLWYISESSLLRYKDKSGSYKPTPPERPSALNQGPEAIVSFDGREYVSAARAGEITGYTQDYVGQLAREGKVLSRQIGSRWYVERSGIRAHKAEKDALLGAVQAEAVGIRQKGSTAGLDPIHGHDDPAPYFTYTNDEGDLLPFSAEESQESADFSPVVPLQRNDEWDDTPHKVPIRVLADKLTGGRRESKASGSASTGDGKLRSLNSKAKGWRGPLSWASAALATIVIVLTIGYVSSTNSALYAQIRPLSKESATALASRASEAISGIGAVLEAWLVPGVVYRRTN